MLNFSISELSLEELKNLKVRVDERLRQAQRLSLQPGQRVAFNDKNGNELRGMIVRRNTKTMNIMTDSGTQWRVSPSLLRAL